MVRTLCIRRVLVRAAASGMGGEPARERGDGEKDRQRDCPGLAGGDGKVNLHSGDRSVGRCQPPSRIRRRTHEASPRFSSQNYVAPAGQLVTPPPLALILLFRTSQGVDWRLSNRATTGMSHPQRGICAHTSTGQLTVPDTSGMGECDRIRVEVGDAEPTPIFDALRQAVEAVFAAEPTARPEPETTPT
jgi:hypothetical protein